MPKAFLSLKEKKVRVRNFEDVSPFYSIFKISLVNVSGDIAFY